MDSPDGCEMIEHWRGGTIEKRIPLKDVRLFISREEEPCRAEMRTAGLSAEQRASSVVRRVETPTLVARQAGTPLA